MEPLVSIIIPVFNNFGYTFNCLISIFQHTSFENFEVIVVDDNSTDETKDFFNAQNNFGGKIRYIRLPNNLGFSKACNIGAKNAKGEILVFLNNDTIPLNGWLYPIFKEIKENPKTITGSKLLYPDGTIQHAGVVVTETNWPSHLYVHFPKNFHGANKKREFRMVTGACLGIEKKRFFDLGGFCEEYINGFEDVDLCIEHIKKGGGIIYLPESEVIHYEQISRKENSQEVKNSILLTKRQKDFIWPDIRRYLVEDEVCDRYIATPKGDNFCLLFPFKTGLEPTLLKVVNLIAEGKIKNAYHILSQIYPILAPDHLFLSGLCEYLLGFIKKGEKKLKEFYKTEPSVENKKFLLSLGLFDEELLGWKEFLIEDRKVVSSQFYIEKVLIEKDPKRKAYFLEKLKTKDPYFYLKESYRCVDKKEAELREKIFNLKRRIYEGCKV